MSSVISLKAHELYRFSLPHAVRLVGEHQHLLGAGTIALATDLRLRLEADEMVGDFSLTFAVGGSESESLPWPGAPPAEDFAARWQDALGEFAVADRSRLEGLSIFVDFGDVWEICPPHLLLGSPALAAALAIAAVAHRGGGGPVTDVELAQLACRLRQAVMPTDAEGGERFFGEALLSIVGGAGYVEPGGERLNVQQLLPPESLLLALCQGPIEHLQAAQEGEQAARQALARAQREVGDITRGDEASLAALFGLGDSVLDERETTMLYGLLRVREMAESFLERLGAPLVDNDELAEMCDEESVILEDYFGFPGRPYAPVRAAAREAGALGAKLTWVFGGYPAAIIIAPGRRQEVLDALRERFPDVHFLLVNMDPTGLLRGDQESPDF